MLHGVKIDMAFGQLRSEGIRYLYRGLLPPLAQKTLSLSVMFGVYDGIKKPAIEHYKINQYYAKCFAGCVAGTGNLIIQFL